MGQQPKKKTVDEVFAQITDFQKNLQLSLDGLQQNVNTVGQVVAGESPVTSAGSASSASGIKAGLGSGGTDPNMMLYLGIGLGAYLYLKK